LPIEIAGCSFVGTAIDQEPGKKMRSSLGTNLIRATWIPALIFGSISCNGSEKLEETALDASKHSHNAIDYIEFTVTDMAESKAFYSAAFDWKFNDYGPDYAGIQGDGREAGGFTVGARPNAGGSLVILFSEELDESLAKVRAAGGVIVTEPFEFPGGRRFHFTDPSGNELAVWAYK
jgi:predicted enzyme related to lactoylglutathione lyase